MYERVGSPPSPCIESALKYWHFFAFHTVDGSRSQALPRIKPLLLNFGSWVICIAIVFVSAAWGSFYPILQPHVYNAVSFLGYLNPQVRRLPFSLDTWRRLGAVYSQWRVTPKTIVIYCIHQLEIQVTLHSDVSVWNVWKRNGSPLRSSHLFI